jgi:hypothetical protein
LFWLASTRDRTSHSCHQVGKPVCFHDGQTSHACVRYRVTLGPSFKELPVMCIGRLPSMPDTLAPADTETDAPPTPPARTIGGPAALRDSVRAVFAPGAAFTVGETVLVPRSSGGLSYGRVAQRAHMPCPGAGHAAAASRQRRRRPLPSGASSGSESDDSGTKAQPHALDAYLVHLSAEAGDARRKLLLPAVMGKLFDSTPTPAAEPPTSPVRARPATMSGHAPAGAARRVSGRAVHEAAQREASAAAAATAQTAAQRQKLERLRALLGPSAPQPRQPAPVIAPTLGGDSDAEGDAADFWLRAGSAMPDTAAGHLHPAPGLAPIDFAAAEAAAAALLGCPVVPVAAAAASGNDGASEGDGLTSELGLLRVSPAELPPPRRSRPSRRRPTPEIGDVGGAATAAAVKVQQRLIVIDGPNVAVVRSIAFCVAVSAHCQCRVMVVRNAFRCEASSWRRITGGVAASIPLCSYL